MLAYTGTLRINENTALLPITVSDAVKYNDRTLTNVIKQLESASGSHITQNFNTTSADGFYIVDANGFIVLKVDEEGVDISLITAHLKSLIGGSNEVKAERPIGGFENFGVDVDYYTDDFEVTDKTTVANSTDGVYTDYGIIALPSTYKSSGERTRLVIMCGGTGERINATTNPLTYPPLYKGGWEHWLKLGFAVMDVNGIAEGWSNAKGFPRTNQHYSHKYLIQSYKEAYKYVTDKYNLYKEVIICGISMGGSASIMLVYSGLIPAICHCLFAPTVSVFKNNFSKPWQYADQLKTMAGQWNFPQWQNITVHNTDNTYDITDPTDGVRYTKHNYFLKYKDYWIGFDNLFQNTFGSTIDEALNGGSGEEEAFNQLQKYYPIPLMVWHGTSDSVVERKYSKYFVDMIKRGGGKAWYRLITSGTHEDGWKCGEVTLDNVDGDTFTTSVPLAEAYNFVKRWI